MKGFATAKSQPGPDYKLPEDWTGMRICLKWTGGIGDTLMAIGGAALAVKEKECHVTACVMPHHIPLVEKLEGVDHVIRGPEINNVGIRNSFDVVVDFAFAINTSREIREGAYYELLGNHIGLNLTPGKFTSIARTENDLDEKFIYIHPGASNPNRRWDESKWYEVAYSLRDWGYHIVWIGTKDEFGFTDDRITKLSDTSDDLLWQVEQIAANANYFIGCDSGFAHVCGLLGIEGLVLFFTTDPESVIGMYPKLRGLSCYEELQVTPSRSLRAYCETGAKCSIHITAKDVLQNCKIPIIEELKMLRNASPSEKMNIGVYGNTAHADAIANFLAQNNNVEILDAYPEFNDGFDVFIEVAGDRVKIVTPAGTEATVNANHPENIKRAIREILGRG